LARTANLNKKKDYIGTVPAKDSTQPSNYYKWFKFLKYNGLNFVVCLKWADFLEEVNHQPGRKYHDMTRGVPPKTNQSASVSPWKGLPFFSS